MHLRLEWRMVSEPFMYESALPTKPYAISREAWCACKMMTTSALRFNTAEMLMRIIWQPLKLARTFSGLAVELFENSTKSCHCQLWPAMR